MSWQRRLPAAAVLLTVPILAAPATPASAAACSPGAFSARASADLVRVGLLDLRPLGLPVGPVADVRVASTSAGMNAKARTQSAAASRYADADLLGLSLPTGPLDKSVAQQAPPTHKAASVASAGAIQLGVARVGLGSLSAHATWAEGMGCSYAGPAGVSRATVADLTVLPGSRNTSLVRAPQNLTSQAVTGLQLVNGKFAAAAAAEIELADLQLLSNSLGVKVLKPPTLAVIATGNARTSTVDYKAPILEISGDGVRTHRLDSPEKQIEVALPPSMLARLGAADRARQEGLPLVGGDPLNSLLAALPIGSLAGITGGGSSSVSLPGLPEIENVPLLPGLLGGVSSAGNGTRQPGAGSLAVLRLSIGGLDKRVTDTGVSAQAASLRLQLVVLGDRRGGESTVLDLGIGLLEVSAVAPRTATTSPGPSPSHSNCVCPPDSSASPSAPVPSPRTSPAGCGGPGCSLPLTGSSGLPFLIGAGVVLAFLGRLLLLLSRRRNAVS
ncbi:LPXTG-motif cell wall-anchored protein [Allocatelliglobosispora scoriae]|uniref:LPXTG-motif cell wall-anchored protein n=1 Tax=Allocatelliglobosispora scoriae TaxID=643052 RepID=A0A841BWP1_9ACTN|nr:LPXTG cell wall anchor domain-containing protein [Allocatelliglobosispora scoriae]MBB5871333.1 LPXTG-motif cell wall-anchored protein [Allocatelliglobosispora scoriae]